MSEHVNLYRIARLISLALGAREKAARTVFLQAVTATRSTGPIVWVGVLQLSTSCSTVCNYQPANQQSAAHNIIASLFQQYMYLF